MFSRLVRRVMLATIVALAPMMAVHAQVNNLVLNQVTLVSNAAGAANPQPAARTFTVTTAGSFSVILTDLDVPAALSSLQLVIANANTKELVMTAAGTQSVTLQPGTYTAQVFATAASGSLGGTFSVQVIPPASSTPLLTFNDVVSASNPSNNPDLSTYHAVLTVTQAGSYTVTLTDLQFPVALSELALIVLPEGAANPTAVFQIPSGATTATLNPGIYDLFVVAIGNPGGVYSLSVTGNGVPTTLASVTEGVGTLAHPINVTIPSGSANDTLSLQLADLGFPAALGSLSAIATAGSTSFGQFTASKSVTGLSGGTVVQVFVAATPGAGGEGAYELYGFDGSGTLTDVSEPVVDSTHYGYAFETTNVEPAGTYQFKLSDFQQPTALASLSAVVAQRGAALVHTSGAAGVAVSTSASGVVDFVVFPALAASGDNSLFGLSLLDNNSNIVYQATQGVGAQFTSTPVSFSTAGTYTISFTDLVYPASFQVLDLIITQGQSVIGPYAAGNTQFTVSAPGTYTFNVLAETGASVNYGMFGITAALVPSVTLTPSASSVDSGQPVTLTWSTTNATSCTASGGPSGSGWTGTLATSGSLTIASLTSTTTFTLTCTGSGNSGTASSTVTVTKPSSKGGGGSMSPLALLLLTGASAWVVGRRRLSLN